MNPETANTEVPEQKIIKSSPSHLVILFLVILGVAILSVLGTYYYLLPQLQNQKNNSYPLQQSDQSNKEQNTIQQVTPVSGNTQATQGWKTYTNTTYKYTIQYPTDFTIDERFAPDAIRISKPDTTGSTQTGFGDVTLQFLGSPSGYVKCATDEACYQWEYTSQSAAASVGSNIKFDIVQRMIVGRVIKGFETWDTGTTDSQNKTVTYIFPMSVNGKYFEIKFQYSGVTVDQARANLSIVDQFLSTFKLTN